MRFVKLYKLVNIINFLLTENSKKFYIKCRITSFCDDMQYKRAALIVKLERQI